MADIVLENIRKVYPGDVTAVKDFNLEIRDKEFVVLVGPSGCGKSTTLRMIAGLEEITEGRLFINGREVNHVHAKDRDIAMVFQNYALYPHMSVYQNMAFALKLRKTPKAEIDRRVRAAAKILDIEELLQRRPKALSGGQRQRVALGRAMVRDPAAFLLDEPLSNLDAKLRTAMRAELIKLHRRLNATFVYVTHDQTEAMTMADRIVIMKDGVIQQVDTPQMLYDRPCNMFVAGFIGSPQINFLPCRLEKSSTGYDLLIQNDRFPLPSERITNHLMQYAGRQLTIGIRPEDIHDAQVLRSAAFASVINTSVSISEPMGSEIYLYLNYGTAHLIARVPPNGAYRPGDEVRMVIDTSKMHFFDPETEGAVV